MASLIYICMELKGGVLYLFESALPVLVSHGLVVDDVLQ